MAENVLKRKPKDIVFADDLTVEWKDGVVAHYPFHFLRDSCPCASCIDEISGEKILDSNTIPADIHIEKAEYVGHYALKITWSDGHDTGLFSFSLLREMFEAATGEASAPGRPYARES